MIPKLPYQKKEKKKSWTAIFVSDVLESSIFTKMIRHNVLNLQTIDLANDSYQISRIYDDGTFEIPIYFIVVLRSNCCIASVAPDILHHFVYSRCSLLLLSL